MKLNTAKKLTAGALALSMMFAMAVPMAFADDSNKTFTNMDSVTVTKVYKKVGEGTSPEETFYLVQDGEGTVTENTENVTVPKIPTIKVDGEDTNYIASAHFAKGAATAEGTSGTFTIDLPNYDKVGVYTYNLKEVDGQTAGVTYRKKTIKLVVTVINQGDGKVKVAAVHTEETDGVKSSSFDDNTYTANTLSVNKKVTGNMGDKGHYFEFTIKLTPEGNKTYEDVYVVSGGSTGSGNATTIPVDGENHTFKLKDSDTIAIINLPAGVTYDISETAVDGYTTYVGDEETEANKKNSTEGTTSGTATTVKFINHKGGDVDTGVILDNAPYILMLAVVAGGAMTLVIKKRREEE